MTRKEKIYSFAGALAFALAYLIYGMVSMRYFQSKLFPVIFSGTVALLAAAGLIAELRKKEPTAGTGKAKGEKKERESWGQYVRIGAWCAGFLVAIYLIGFPLSIPLFVLSYLKTHRTGWLGSIVTAVLAGGIIYGVFIMVLRVNLYRGILFGV